MLSLRKAYWLALILLAAVAFNGCSPSTNREQESAKALAPRPTIVFMTDFGTANDAVAICKAVILKIVPDVRIMDITHQVTPFSIEEASRFLAGVSPYYPPGTVFLVVVDPGVGTSRKAIIVKTKKGQYFDLPDNGLITPVADRDGVEGIHEITNPAWMIGAKTSSTFHGRDIFSPAGAHLARGDDWTTAGPALDVSKLVRLAIHSATIDATGLHGQVIGTDGPFGNLILNIPAEEFAKLGYRLGDTVPVQIGGKQEEFSFVKTFSDVAIGKPLFYIDSRGRLSLAVNQGNFATTYSVQPPTEILIPKKH